MDERIVLFFFFQAEDGIRDVAVTGVQTCALPICRLAVSRSPETNFSVVGRSRPNPYQPLAWVTARRKAGGVRPPTTIGGVGFWRSEERRVWKEWRFRGSPHH